MDVRFATFKMIVKVVSEEVDQVDGVVPGVLVDVPGKQDEGDVTNSFASSRICVLETHWRFPDNIIIK